MSPLASMHKLRGITQKVEQVEEPDKRGHLLDLLAHLPLGSRTLIFASTQDVAGLLAEFLLNSSVKVTSLHGGRTQHERELALQSFSLGHCGIMVATQIATRGLAIEGVTHVVIYDLPSSLDQYKECVERVAEKKGEAIVFFNRASIGIARQLVQLLKENQREVPLWLENMAREAESGVKGSGSGYGGGGGGKSWW